MRLRLDRDWHDEELIVAAQEHGREAHDLVPTAEQGSPSRSCHRRRLSAHAMFFTSRAVRGSVLRRRSGKVQGEDDSSRVRDRGAARGPVRRPDHESRTRVLVDDAGRAETAVGGSSTSRSAATSIPTCVSRSSRRARPCAGAAWQGTSHGRTTTSASSWSPRGGDALRFWQEYARELSDDDYGVYNFNWGYYLESLRLLGETGRASRSGPASSRSARNRERRAHAGKLAGKACVITGRLPYHLF